MSEIDPSVRENSVAFAVTVGNAVRMFRAERGWQLKDLAEHIGLSPTVVCRTELGRRPIDMERLFILASALGVKPTELIDRAMHEMFPFGWSGDDPSS